MLRKLSLPTTTNWKPSFTSPIILIDSIQRPKNKDIHLMISANRNHEFQRFFSKKLESSILTFNLGEINQQQQIQTLFIDSSKINEYEARCEKGDLQAINEYAPCLLLGKNGVQINEEKAVKYFTIGSKKHDIESTFWLAFCLYNGQGVKTDFSKAAELFKETADKGKLESLLYLYQIHHEGQGIEKDEKKALFYLKTAADKELTVAITKYALTLKEDDPRRYEYLKRSAEQGEINGQFYYGQSLIKGMGGQKSDKAKGFFFLIKAAEGGLASAQNCVGDVFMEGVIGPKDEGMAIHYYELSSIQNNSEANLKLAHIYMNKDKKQDEYVRYLKKAADLGNVEAMFEYGDMIYLGRIGSTNKNKKEASKYIKMAADQGMENAMIMYALFAETGTGFDSKDLKVADHYYKMAADKTKSLRSCKTYMRFLNKNRRYNDANKYMILAGKAGDSECLYGSALLYYVNKNQAECEKCLKLAIDKGNPDAMNFYGSIMISKKPQESLQILKKAIEKGSVPAMFTYASYLSDGRFSTFSEGEKIDKSEVFKYMKMAADHNFKEAVIKCADMLHDGKFCDKNVKESLVYYKKAADLFNIASSQFTYGEALLSGCNGAVEVNLKEGAAYVKKAADQNFASAVYKLGCIYKNGFGFDKNDVKAFECFKKAADLGVIESIRECGYALFNGKGVKKNQAEASKYFIKGVDAKDPICMFNLGLIYISGEGVQKDTVKGKIYLEMSSKKGIKNALEIGEKIISQKSSASEYIKV